MRLTFPAALLASAALSACSSKWKPPEISYDEPVAAPAAATPPSKPIELAPAPTALPPGDQAKRAARPRPSKSEPADPQARVEAANEAARVKPSRAGYVNAVQVYPFSEGALYQVYTAPSQITDIALEAGEQLVGSGPVAAGDTVRWIIGDTESGTGGTRRVHILVKPTRADLRTNLIINTDRRTYHLELRSGARTYMASVSWSYPQDELVALRRHNDADGAGSTSVLPSLESLNFRYRIAGDDPPWRPIRAVDDGRQVYIEFPAGIAQGEMPPIWIIGPDGGAELVNYRVRGRYMVVDRLFAGAELRLGGKRQQRVRIVRTDGKKKS